MTTRYNAVLVTFENEIREDDLENWINAFRMFHHVVDVRPVAENSFEHITAREQAYFQLRRELQDSLFSTSWKKG
jgi:hypothetical protein